MAGGAVSAPLAEDLPHRETVVIMMFEEPYALMCARTDLWELGEGVLPGPPGQFGLITEYNMIFDR